MNNINKYIDQFGLIALETDGVKGNATQNGVMWTAEYLIASKELGLLDEATEKQLLKAIADCQGENGETYRHPGKIDEWDAMDNVVGFLATQPAHSLTRWYNSGSDKLDKVDDKQDTQTNTKFLPYAKLAKLIGYSGSYFPWSREPMYWNNTQPDKFTLFGWYGRSSGFMGWIDLAVKGHTTLLRHAVLIIEQLKGCLGVEETLDGLRMTHTSFQFLRKANPIYKLTYKLWCRNLLKKYPGGMKDVYKLYYQSPTHPIRQLEFKYAK